MYTEYLGENYHWEIRKLLGAGDTLCPDSIIDAEYNIGAMKMIMTQKMKDVARIDSEEKFQKLSKAARYYLVAVICVALRSRTAVAPYNTSKYRRDWDKIRGKCLSKAEKIMHSLRAY
jgi:hypothetical protein